MSSNADYGWNAFVVVCVMTVALFVGIIVTVSQRNGALGQLCNSHVYSHAASGNVLTITVDGHRYTDVHCDGP